MYVVENHLTIVQRARALRRRRGVPRGVRCFFPRADRRGEDRDGNRKDADGADGARGRDLSDVGTDDSRTARGRGERTWRDILTAIAYAGGSLADWGDATYAELDVVSKARRYEEWERVVFVATLAFNSNPYLKNFVEFDNPFDEEKKEKKGYKKVGFDEVFAEDIKNQNRD